MFKIVFAFWLLSAISVPACAFDMMIHTGYKNTPAFTELGFVKSEIIYEQEIFAHKEDRSNPLSKRHYEKITNKLDETDGYAILDIEYWLKDWRRFNYKQKFNMVHRYADTLRETKKVNQNKKLGFFRVVPAWAHWDIISSQEHFNNWQRENELRQVIADSVDVLYPSLYTYHEEPEDWILWAKTIIAKARNMANGKKVIPFIWPRFHQSSGPYRRGRKELPAHYWRAQLELVASIADGVVIWNGALGNKGNWDESERWWIETKAFMEDNAQLLNRDMRSKDL